MLDATRTVRMDERMWRQITRSITLILHHVYLRDMANEVWKVIETMAPEYVMPQFDFAAKKNAPARNMAILRRAITTYLRIKQPNESHDAMRAVLWNDLEQRRRTWAWNGGKLIAYRVMRYLMHMH